MAEPAAVPGGGPLAEAVARRIAVQGPLTVSEFMTEALYNPRHGYYVTGGGGPDPFGAAGDFTTAPEISQMYGELIGLWCADQWLRMDRPSDVALIELGPGRGTLMADLLRAGDGVPGFTEAVSVHLVEISPPLRAAQAKRLDGRRAAWHDALDTVPHGTPSFIVASEFFDALPVRQFVRLDDGGWAERLVGLDPDTGGLGFTRTPAAAPAATLLAPAVRDAPLAVAPAGTVAEARPAGVATAGALAARVAAHRGAALIVDYGYAAAPGTVAVGDTLQALRGHAPQPPLADPGRADLTAHVDFAALARAARDAGAAVHGPVDQGAWLGALGIAARADRLKRGAGRDQAAAIDRALARLIAPDRMGKLFQVLAFRDPAGPVPGGFEGADA